jgi:hypothetical protein
MDGDVNPFQVCQTSGKEIGLVDLWWIGWWANRMAKEREETFQIAVQHT